MLPPSPLVLPAWLQSCDFDEFDSLWAFALTAGYIQSCHGNCGWAGRPQPLHRQLWKTATKDFRAPGLFAHGSPSTPTPPSAPSTQPCIRMGWVFSEIWGGMEIVAAFALILN